MRWSLGPFYVGYTVNNVPGWGFWRGRSKDGFPLIALCFRSFAIGGGVAVGPRSPWQRKKDRRAGAARFRKLTADLRAQRSPSDVSEGVNP